ncbi:MAG: T9SS type A sorting domain-containing protein, partial [Bacteroidia bacterium]|nr:T9SS type A sorting domain-containing protein [Bacteroidia bacterium]
VGLALIFVCGTGTTRNIASGTVLNALNITLQGNNLGVLNNSGSVTFTNSFTINAPTFNNLNGGTVVCQKALSVTGTGVFNASAVGNLVQFTTTGYGTVYGTTYYNLTLDNAATGGITSKSLAGDITVGGTLTLASNIVLNCNNRNITINGTWMNNGTLAGNNPTNTGGTFTFGGTNPTILRRTIQETLGNVVVNCTGSLIPNSTNTATYTGNFTCQNLTLTNGTLDLNSTGNYTVSVKGNMSVGAGNLTGQNGVMNFNGTTAQTIGGGTVTFSNMTIANAAGVSTTAAENITATLTVSSGTFTSNTADFTLISDATTAVTARVATLTGSIAGNRWVIQRRIITTGNSTNDAYWGDFSSPVTSTTLSDWDSEMYLSGVGGADGTACCPTFQSVMEWNNGGGDYTAVTSLINLTPGFGYTIWTASTLTTLTAFTFDSKGTPNSGSIPVSCPVADFYLVGNPYPSQVIWSSLTKSNIGDYFYCLDESLQDYASWDGSAGTGTGKLNGTNGVINSSQGMLVESLGSGTLTFTEASKSSATTDFVRMPAPVNMVKFHFSNGQKQVGMENMIHFVADANNGKDALDMGFIKSPFAKKYEVKTLTTNGLQLCKNTLNLSENKHEVPMVFIPADGGTYTVSFDGLASFDVYNCIYLEDVAEGKFTDLKENSSYTFTQTDNKERKFVIHFKRAENASESCVMKSNIFQVVDENTAIANVFANQSGIVMNFNNKENTKIKVSVYSAMGQLVSVTEQYYGNGQYSIEKPSVPGIYIVNLSDGKKTETHKIFVSE